MGKDPFDKNSFIITPQIQEFLEKYEIRRLRRDFFDRLTLLVIAGLGLITALAWDEFFKKVFHHLFGELEGLAYDFLYAFILTALTTFATLILKRLFRGNTKRE